MRYEEINYKFVKINEKTNRQGGAEVMEYTK